jgi:hypothetical protein
MQNDLRMAVFDDFKFAACSLYFSAIEQIRVEKTIHFRLKFKKSTRQKRLQPVVYTKNQSKVVKIFEN